MTRKTSMRNMRNILKKAVATVVLAAMTVIFTGPVFAHGERAQQANLRIRSMNWYDMEFSTTELAVNEILVLKGKMQASGFWPEHIPGVDGNVYLNIGSAGPTFVRLSSKINGQSVIQSTSLEYGETYDFEVVLKARRPGRYHLHPLLNVEDTGALVGPGRWIVITGDQADFTNTAETMFGNVIDMENFWLTEIFTWHAIWLAIGLAWFLYWVRPTNRPVLLMRYRMVKAKLDADEDPDDLIPFRENIVGAVVLVLTLILVGAGFFWADQKFPVTTPLRSATVKVFPTDLGIQNVEAEVVDATYRIPGRSFRMKVKVTNNGDSPVQMGEFLIANIRFINPDVMDIQPIDSHDLVAPNGLRVPDGVVQPGETRDITVYAEDAMWETWRLTTLINDPDSLIVGMAFFFAEDGERSVIEIGGPMLPVFE